MKEGRGEKGGRLNAQDNWFVPRNETVGERVSGGRTNRETSFRRPTGKESGKKKKRAKDGARKGVGKGERWVSPTLGREEKKTQLKKATKTRGGDG